MQDPAVASTQATRGVVYTFYSFKGGVGRSMALANAASLLAKWGKRVLVLDWDLEAPGLEKFFQHWTNGTRKNTSGLVDIINAFASGAPRDWRDCRLRAKLPDHPQEIHIITAGQDGSAGSADDYGRNLQQIKWEWLFDEKRFGGYLERLRSEWTAEYDFVLVDSRTGITDIGGICTIHLPDVLVCLFTTTEQSLQGVKDVMERAAVAHASLPVDRKKLMIVPLPARDESRTEYKLAKEWRARFATDLAPFYKDWAPKGEKAEDVLDLLKIPYVAFWSFGERLPVLEEDVNNPDKLSYFYQLIARLMLGKLDLQEVRQGTLSSETAEAQRVEAAKRAEAAAALRLRAQQESAAQERVKRDEELARRRSQYEQYLKSRLRPNQELSNRRAFVASVASFSVGLGGAFLWYLYFFWYSFAFSLNDRYRPEWAVTFAILLTGVALGLLYTNWLFLRKSSLLLDERALFESQVGRYDAADLEALPQFIERVESIIASSIFERPTPPAQAGREPGPSDSVAPKQTSVLDPFRQQLERDVVVNPPAVFKGAEAPAAPPVAAPSSRPPLGTEYDVYVSARRDPFISAWLKEFLPLFRSWVSDLAGHDISIFLDENPGADRAELRSVLDRSKCLLAIVTPAYFQSQWNKLEWDAFEVSRPDAIVPILLRGTYEALPAEARRIHMANFTDYVFIGEGFQKTQAYVEFQGAIRRLAERVVDLVKTRDFRQQ